MFQIKIKMLQNEYWYGLCVNDGIKFPLSQKSSYSIDLDPNPTNNQSVPLLISNYGRYLWSDKGFQLNVENGEILCESKKSEIILAEGFETLKGAFLAAGQRFFPANGEVPPISFFQKPQYNTWIELIYNQNQKDILQYAENILKNDMAPGILMIDDGWCDYYGRWDFNRRTFPNPKQMVDQLHSMGFEVMLWTCPFISPDSVEMKELHKKGFLIQDKQGEPVIRKWWNGYSAVLDFTNPQCEDWYDTQLQELMKKYGIDGFKFDAGDGIYYKEDDITFIPADANKHTELWARFGLRYPYNEYRACFRCGGLPLVQRLADKNHSWTDNGVASLVPNQLAQGIMGYSFTCPDMIGGGEYENFLSNSERLDEELFVRYAQCAALMPMIQFSAAPWRVLSDKNNRLCVAAANLHSQFSEYIYELAQHAAKSGEPIVRYMEYEFPNQGMEQITNQFMLGDKLLAAPVLNKGETTRLVILPEGKWRYVDGMVYEKGCVQVAAPIEILPYFLKI